MMRLEHISALVTCTGTPREPGVIEDAAVVFDRHIRWVGRRSEVPAGYRDLEVHDAGGRLVVPGLVDCHTHVVFGGWRADEWEQRLGGATYQAIAAAGGGIMRTVRDTRAASSQALAARATGFLDGMRALGICTVESKSGYGLTVEEELRLLRINRALGRMRRIVSTLLAHVVPPERRADRLAYVDELAFELLPRACQEGLADACDVYVDDGAFTPDEARRILSAAKAAGLAVKVHADQHREGGGAALAASLGARSADHLEHVSDAGIAALREAGTVAVTLPLAALSLGGPVAPARRMLDAGVEVAVATDFNPGTAPSFHLPLAMSLACTVQRMTPMESLWGATRAAARALGLEGVGELREGAAADLAIIDAESVAHWLYHFRPSACVETIVAGELTPR